MTDQTRTREQRLRRMADRQGLAILKNRRRDPRARDYGLYWLCWDGAFSPETSHDAWVGYPKGFTLEQVEDFLTNDETDAYVYDELQRTKPLR